MPLPTAPRWLFALKGALALGALAALVAVADPAEVAAAIAHADPRWALIALLLAPLNIGLEAYRWGRLVRRIAPEVRYRDVLRAVVGSYPLGLLTPGRVGDFVGRALYLRAIPAGVSAALTFAERMATMAAILLGGLLALTPFLATQADPSPLWPAVTAVGLLATGGLALCILFPSLARTAIGTVLPFRRVKKAVAAFEQIPPEEGATLLGLSLVRYGVFAGQFVLLARALAPEVAWADLGMAVALVFFAKSLLPQVTLGDLGIREGAAVFFFGAVGMAPAAALDASLALFGLNLLLPALAGIPLLLSLRRSAADAPHPAGAPA